MGWRIPYTVSVEEAKDTHRFFKIPVSILEKVVEYNLFGPFRLFMYFKTVSNGQMRICPETIRLAAADLDISERTVKRHLEALQNRNWVGRFKMGGYIIRSFDKLREMEKVSGRTAIWFDVKQHLKSFREYVISACLGSLIRRQRGKLWREKCLPGSKSGSPNERKHPLPTSYPIACDAMKQLYNIAKGTAFNWKRSAAKAGFITVYKKLKPVLIDNVLEWKRANPELAYRLIKRDDRYFVQYPDKVICHLKFTRRRSLSALDKK